MATLAMVMEARQLFKTKFPKYTASISGPTNQYYLVVRVRDEDEGKKIPTEFHGVRVETRIMNVKRGVG